MAVANRSSGSSNQLSAENRIFEAIFNEFNGTYQHGIILVEKLSFSLIFLGVFGNTLGLTVLLKARSMGTPSYSYHKALIASDLVFCLNWLSLHLIRYTHQSSAGYFNNYAAALYSGVFIRAISSTCGYVNLYMTVFIAFDRFLALIIPIKYKIFNRKVVARALIAIAVLLSASIHSWATWVETEVFTLGQILDKTSNKTISLYAQKPRKIPDVMIRTKDIYNAVVRIPYPFLLAILTGFSIWRFSKNSSRRRAMLATSVANRQNQRRQQRRERSLFLLMVCVVLLTFIQVLPTEGKRVLELLYSEKDMLQATLNRQYELSHRISCFKTMLYGHKFLQLITNLATAINRSLLFYLYLFLNPSFRATCILWFRSCLGGKLGGSLTGSQSSFNRKTQAGRSGIQSESPSHVFSSHGNNGRNRPPSTRRYRTYSPLEKASEGLREVALRTFRPRQGTVA